MNRKERRKSKEQFREPVYNLKKSQIDQMLAEERRRAKEFAIEEAFLLMVAIPVKVMHDQYGWKTKKRLPEFAEAITDEYQRFADGEMTAEQYRQFVYETCGLMFKRNDEDGRETQN